MTKLSGGCPEVANAETTLAPGAIYKHVQQKLRLASL